MAIKGIDVSVFQGNVNYSKVKAAGYSFVIIRAGYGRYINQKDPYFEQNYKNAKAAGLNVGAYWYSYAKTAADAKMEAQVFMQVAKGKQFDYPLSLDIEDVTQTRLSNSTIGAIINAFCGELEKGGYYANLYSFVSFLNSKVPAACKSKYDVWVAHYGVSKPSCANSYGIWQYSSTGKVPGVSGNCDCDYAYKDYPKLIKSAGLNGYPKPLTEKILDTEGFKSGDKSIGVLALKHLLILAKAKGLVQISVDNNKTFGAGTNSAVNNLLGYWGYKPNGVAGENFIKMLGEKLK